MRKMIGWMSCMAVALVITGCTPPVTKKEGLSANGTNVDSSKNADYTGASKELGAKSQEQQATPKDAAKAVQKATKN